MKKLFLSLSVVFAAILVLSACDQDKDGYKIEEWDIASSIGVGTTWTNGFQPAYIVKRGPSRSWLSCTEPIEGFVFEEGYEYHLRVRIDQSGDMLESGSASQYTMLDMISRQKVQTVDPEEYCPKFEVIVASELGEKAGRPFYWIKIPASGNPQWVSLNHPIEGFDYIPGFEYRLQVRVGADGTPGNDSAGIHYTLLEALGCEQIHSAGLPATN